MYFPIRGHIAYTTFSCLLLVEYTIVIKVILEGVDYFQLNTGLTMGGSTMMIRISCKYNLCDETTEMMHELC